MGEIAACAPWLAEQIRLIDPKLIVTLGNVAMRRFRDRKDKIGDVRGRCFVWKGRTIIPTFHPIYVRLNPQTMQDYRKDFTTIRGPASGSNHGRLINHRGYGHHSATAVVAMIYLCCGGITVELPTVRA